MKKNDLMEAFSAICDYIADNLHDLLLTHLDDDMLMITPMFEDAHIVDIDQWWKMNGHYSKYWRQIENLVSEDWQGYIDNVHNGIAEVKESAVLKKQLEAIEGGTSQGKVQVLRHTPHIADYAEEFKETKGFRRLDELCLMMDNVFIWPMVTVNENASDLKSAFYLNVAIVSGDGAPLKPKIRSLPKLIS